MRQRAPPAVDVLGGNPQAAQNVAGESPRHAQQPAAAAPRPVPPSTHPSSVPVPESNNSAFLRMENAPPTNLPETLPISSDSKVSEDVPVEESVVGVSRSLPIPLSEDCGSSPEKQRLPTPPCPPLTSEVQIDSTVQELHYGSQTDKEKSHSNSQTNQIQPLREDAGLAVITGTKEQQSVTLEYKPETATDIELGGKEHRDGNILHQPQSPVCSVAPPVPQSSVGFKVQGPTEPGSLELSDREEDQSGHASPSGAAEQTDSHQDSKSSLLSSPSSDSREIKQTDMYKTQPHIGELSNDAGELQNANSLESVEMLERVEEPVEASHKETPKAGEVLPGMCSLSGQGASQCGGAAGGEAANIQKICDPLEGEHVEREAREEQPDATTFCSSTEESSPKPSLFDTGLVVSLQAEQVVAADASHPSDQVLTTETPLSAQLVHSVDAQEIVVVREDAHISGDWSNVHLNQSYLLQREDGSVCEAAIVNELSSELSSGEPKLYEEGVQADIELHSQPVEVYEFCGLVEEVAEETVCASSIAQMPPSPGYEVNLFNALLENPNEDLEPHLRPSIHTITEGSTVIISQQPLPSSHDANQIQPCSHGNAHSLSLKSTRVAAVGQHLVLEANQVADSSQVCLVEVAAETSGAFTVEQADASLQIVAPCSQVAAQNQMEGSECQTVSPKQEAEATAGVLSFLSPVVTGEDVGMTSPVAVSVHVSHVQTQPSLNQTSGLTVVSAAKPALTPSQTVSPQRNPEAFGPALSSGVINPKLLLLKCGERPLLKHPPSLLGQVSQQQNAAGKLANAHSSWPGAESTECLPQTVSAADSIRAPEQTQLAVDETAAASTASLQLDQTASVVSVASPSKSDNEALIITKMSTTEADVAFRGVVTPTDATPNTLYVLPASEEGDGTVLAPPSPTDPVSHPDSLYMEDESEDMEQDEPLGETEAQEATSGQVSPEEASDEEPDLDKTESEMTTPGLPHKVFPHRISLLNPFPADLDRYMMSRKSSRQAGKWPTRT